jgi:enoyl-CoA hydratase/carnithine racemase
MDILGSLPVIVVGDGFDPRDPPAYVDAVIEPAVAGFDDLLAVIDSVPLAATSLALLLRGHDARSLGEGLVAESMAYSMLQAGPEFKAWRSGRDRREWPAESEPTVLVDRRDDHLELTLNRPHVHNALNVRMRDELIEGLTVAAADPTVRSVALRGAGPCYSSGGDLDEFGSFADPASAHLIRLDRSIGRLIASLGERIVVYMHGPCAGSGIELPAFAASAVAAPGTTFTLPELSLGLLPGAGGTASISRRIGRHRTALLALSTAHIDATTALAWGLIDRLADQAG